MVKPIRMITSLKQIMEICASQANWKMMLTATLVNCMACGAAKDHLSKP